MAMAAVLVSTAWMGCGTEAPPTGDGWARGYPGDYHYHYTFPAAEALAGGSAGSAARLCAGNGCWRIPEKKKIVIHVPIHKKIEKHIHTVVKHVHHHHKPLVLKEEKKVIHEDHRPIQIHQTKEHFHHHSLPLAAAAPPAVPEPELEEEEEHIHHHHNYEHRGGLRDDFIGGDGSSSEER
ncbi:uncharacterized protein LOC110180092 [Drosophila serrata]|uniref:uncharacterized protein LOC110180092 n=1 Tax=Drosophila serrata TaxID=7274 RepID=UPI000A1D1642|nr:uncharacterized protein LOC110180092 [Drosophila serrata]